MKNPIDNKSGAALLRELADSIERGYTQFLQLTCEPATDQCAMGPDLDYTIKLRVWEQEFQREQEEKPLVVDVGASAELAWREYLKTSEGQNVTYDSGPAGGLARAGFFAGYRSAMGTLSTS